MSTPRTNDDYFSVSVRRVGDDQVVVVDGELDMAAVDPLLSAIDSVYSAGRPLVIDLANTTFMDSSGIKALLSAYVSRGRVPEGVVLHHPSPAVRHVLEMTGLLDVFTLVDGD